MYSTAWTPALGEILYTIHDRHNAFDLHAIAARKRLPASPLLESTVNHLPKEISIITRYNYNAIWSYSNSHGDRYTSSEITSLAGRSRNTYLLRSLSPLSEQRMKTQSRSIVN